MHGNVFDLTHFFNVVFFFVLRFVASNVTFFVASSIHIPEVISFFFPSFHNSVHEFSKYCHVNPIEQLHLSSFACVSSALARCHFDGLYWFFSFYWKINSFGWKLKKKFRILILYKFWLRFSTNFYCLAVHW